MKIFGIKLVSVKEWERLLDVVRESHVQPIRTKRKYVKSGKYSKKNK